MIIKADHFAHQTNDYAGTHADIFIATLQNYYNIIVAISKIFMFDLFALSCHC